LEKLAVERSVRLWANPKYVFDEKEAEWAIGIIAIFKHTKGDYKGILFQLTGWQKYFIAHLFGLKYKSSGLRVTKKALLEIAKKGGKSEFAAAIGVVMAFMDGEQTAECYTVANKRDQAKFSYDSAKEMVKYIKKDDGLPDVRIYDSQQSYMLISKLENEDVTPDGSFFKAIATDSGTLDGVFPHLGLIDEYHAAPDTSIADNLESGMVSRSQPLLLIITTRGFHIQGPLWNLEQSYTLILEGLAENDEVFVLIFAMDEGDDWEDEKNWEKANPSIGLTPTWEGLRSQLATALTEGAERLNSFKTKNLNLWVESAKAWIEREDYMQAGTDFDEKILLGRRCFAGLDLAASKDLTAWVLLFPPTNEDPKFRCLSRFYVPAGNAMKRTKLDKVPYMDWAENGWIVLTDKRTTDYAVVEAQIVEDFSQFNIVKANYDRFNSSDLINRLEELELEMHSFNQSFVSFSPAVSALEKIVLEGLFDHQNNPVLAWNFRNAVLKQDAGGNVRLDKAKSRERIDGAVAAAMAKAAYLDFKDEPEPSGILVW
jgi:phage terminase large subunit-like protein